MLSRGGHEIGVSTLEKKKEMPLRKGKKKRREDMCQHAEVACFFVSGDTEYKQKESPYTQRETKRKTKNKQQQEKKKERKLTGEKRNRETVCFSLFDKELKFVMGRINTPRRFPPCLSALFL